MIKDLSFLYELSFNKKKHQNLGQYLALFPNLPSLFQGIPAFPCVNLKYT